MLLVHFGDPLCDNAVWMADEIGNDIRVEQVFRHSQLDIVEREFLNRWKFIINRFERAQQLKQ